MVVLYGLCSLLYILSHKISKPLFHYIFQVIKILKYHGICINTRQLCILKLYMVNYVS